MANLELLKCESVGKNLNLIDFDAVGKPKSLGRRFKIGCDYTAMPPIALWHINQGNYCFRNC